MWNYNFWSSTPKHTTRGSKHSLSLTWRQRWWILPLWWYLFRYTLVCLTSRSILTYIICIAIFKIKSTNTRNLCYPKNAFRCCAISVTMVADKDRNWYKNILNPHETAKYSVIVRIVVFAEVYSAIIAAIFQADDNQVWEVYLSSATLWTIWQK